VPATRDTEPLFVLEFLHRLVDVLEEFLGAPLLASRIESSYDVVAQILGEMCDAGSVSTTESNALRDVVEKPGWVDKLLGGVGLPASSPSLNPATTFKQQIALNPVTNGPAIPWRRSNVKHTSNELYVDIVETLDVTLAPSGRPLTAFSNGSILFTSKISGVPDLVLSLSGPGGKHNLDRLMSLPTFHPCVRLNRWKERPGELSFVPPDGRFVLAGYEVDLLSGTDLSQRKTKPLNLPATVEVSTSLGPTGAEFEARLILSSSFSGDSTKSLGSKPSPATRGSGRPAGGFFSGLSSPALPTLRDVAVTIPVPRTVRNITDLRASRGEAHFAPTEQTVEWRISTKDMVSGIATLRCTLVGPLEEEDSGTANGLKFDAANGDYDETVDAYDTSRDGRPSSRSATEQSDIDQRRVKLNKAHMPTSAAVSFSVKGWLPSGIKVESLIVDSKKSRGVGEGVKPIKGAKYLTVSKNGVETRC
jgi:AP-3 complex subunit mu